MSNIQIHELSSSGSELFKDSESFLDELSEEETATLIGGSNRRLALSIVSVQSNISVFSNSVITANTNSVNANTIGNVNSSV
ncbi:hypothetical protein IQ238_16150 [Pleurocapsales cyanobacterium LEGE 06147]|nr:hypothetical protein [Pleurocapsales cyanobacterium LEGE 06147]